MHPQPVTVGRDQVETARQGMRQAVPHIGAGRTSQRAAQQLLGRGRHSDDRGSHAAQLGGHPLSRRCPGEQQRAA
ncbi:hypothetical protein RB200_05380 [Streptomyces sp. PmtG]